MRYVTLRELLLLHDSGIWVSEEDVEGGISILRSTNFTEEGEVDFTNLAIKAVLEKDRADKLLASGDILVEKSGGGPKQPVGRVCFFKGDARPHVFGNFVARLRTNHEICYSEYLFYFLLNLHRSGMTLGFQKQTTGIRNLEFKRYLGVEIPLPTLPEQRRIVDLLNHAAGIRRLRRQALETARALIPALFVEMFGEPGRNEKGWEVVELGSKAEIVSVVRTPSLENEGAELCIGPDSIESNTGRLISAPTVSDVLPRSGKYRFTVGEVLYSKIRPYLAKACIAPTNGYCSADMYPLRCKPGILPEFLLNLLLSPDFTAYATNESVRARMPKLNREMLFSYSFPLPPIELQKKFADSVADARALISQQERHLAQADALLQSLMARYFCGAGVGTGLVPARPEGQPLGLPLRKSRTEKQVLPIAAEPPPIYMAGGQAALPAANQPVPGGIPMRLLAAMQPGRAYSRAELLAATEISEADWTWAIRQLKEDRLVVQEGEKRGARYRRA